MTALDKLRELLDARGVHYVNHGGMVRWFNEDGCVCRAYARTNPTSVDVTVTPPSTNVSRMDVSPEQAIEATCLFELRIDGRRRELEVEVDE